MPWLKDNKGNRGRTHMVWEEENTGVEIKSGKWSEASFHSEEMLTGWDCVHQHYAFCELCMTGQKQLDCFILHQGALLSSCCSAVRELWSIVNLEVCVFEHNCFLFSELVKSWISWNCSVSTFTLFQHSLYQSHSFQAPSVLFLHCALQPHVEKKN